MKSGGKSGLFEGNLVVCRKDLLTDGVTIGLSFGGGLTGKQFCAPAFSDAVECLVEHDGGVMKNNVIARCTDVGIAVNKGKNTSLLHNTIIATTGRLPVRHDERRGPGHDGATHANANNLAEISRETFEAMYVSPAHR